MGHLHDDPLVGDVSFTITREGWEEIFTGDEIVEFRKLGSGPCSVVRIELSVNGRGTVHLDGIEDGMCLHENDFDGSQESWDDLRWFLAEME